MVHIRRIREKVELNPKEPDYIKVVWGIGYKMERHGPDEGLEQLVAGEVREALKGGGGRPGVAKVRVSERPAAGCGRRPDWRPWYWA